MSKSKGNNHKHTSGYINRELSWLEFNDRVLEEARDRKNPLLERIKFLVITSTNLDEFFMIRVASLKRLVFEGYDKPDPAGMAPASQLAAIAERTHQMVARQYSTYNRSIVPALEKAGVRLVGPDDLNKEQRSYLEKYFSSTIFPILTPMAVDSSHPFPLLASRSINLSVQITRHDKEHGKTNDMAIVQVPLVLPRLVRLPVSEGYRAILLEDVIRLFIDRLFSGVRIGAVGCFRIMRNADLTLDEEDATDLLKEIEKQLRTRQWGEVIRLEVESNFDSRMLSRLVKHLKISQQDIYKIDGPLDFRALGDLATVTELEPYRYEPYEPQPVPVLQTDDLFQAIRRQDIFLHHPFESFDPVVELIRAASVNPDVLAIKQTLYRVSGNSPIIKSLIDAAESGKQVLVLVELKARFDEENNILWAKELEKAGCHVIYGLVGLKTHSKITLIVRRDADGIRRYLHLGTGNYNDLTARLYTDMGILTCSESLGVDASAFFNMLSGYSAPTVWHKLTPAPYWLRHELDMRIRLEMEHAKAGRPARIIAKVNALVDEAIIGRLYEASQAGVKIDLVVRGICCLQPGVPGLSENIAVRSIIGRFLEHSRIYYFHNDGQQDLFLSSADLMPRNLDRRVELMFPVESPEICSRVMEVLTLELEDTERARIMQPDGHYERVDKRGKTRLDSQQALCELAVKAAQQPIRQPDFRFKVKTQDPVS